MSTVTLRKQISILAILLSVVAGPGAAAGPGPAPKPASSRAPRICEPEEVPLFICQTNRQGKYVAICAVEEEVGKRWSAVQYRFGPEDRAELVYPADARQGAAKLFFSNAHEGSYYVVRIRFVSGGYSYLIDSYGNEKSNPIGDGAAGVMVTDANRKTVADIPCAERPTMYPSYLRLALACDSENPAGKAGCAELAPALPHDRRAGSGARRVRP